MSRHTCGKVRYRSGPRARRALANIRHYGGSDIHPTRAYPCPMCHGWHLTKQAM